MGLVLLSCLMLCRMEASIRSTRIRHAMRLMPLAEPDVRERGEAARFGAVFRHLADDGRILEAKLPDVFTGCVAVIQHAMCPVRLLFPLCCLRDSFVLPALPAAAGVKASEASPCKGLLAVGARWLACLGVLPGSNQHMTDIAHTITDTPLTTCKASQPCRLARQCLQFRAVSSLTPLVTMLHSAVQFSFALQQGQKDAAIAQTHRISPAVVSHRLCQSTFIETQGIGRSHCRVTWLFNGCRRRVAKTLVFFSFLFFSPCLSS